MNYQAHNHHLLQLALSDLDTWIRDPQIQTLVEMALTKAIDKTSQSPAPPVISLLIAEDLQEQNHAAVPDLARACAYFYTAADLLDDIQDKDAGQPVLQKITPEQALNISNTLLMGAYRSIGRADLPTENRLKITEAFTQMGLQMSHGQYWDIASTNAMGFKNTPFQIAQAKAGAELGSFLACVPWGLHNPAPAYYELGEILGILLQTFSDYFDIWMVPHKQALSDDLLVLKNTLPLYAARQDPQWQNDVAAALAGQHHHPAKQFKLRRLLAQTRAIEALEDLLNTLRAHFETAQSALPDLPRITTLLETCFGQSQQLLQGLKSLKSRTPNTPWQSEDLRAKALTMAQQALTFVPEFKDVWEVQRWGFLEANAPKENSTENSLYGDIFNPLLILEALQAAGQPIVEELQRILAKHHDAGWHYYSNTTQIPTDTDDLGQILNLVATSHLTLSDDLRHTLNQALRHLQNNLEQSEVPGRCPTWLADGEVHSRESIQKTWFGDHCPAVMANLYYGLSCYNTSDKDSPDNDSYPSLIQQGINYLVSTYDPQCPGWKPTHYVSATYTHYLIARLFQQHHVDFDFNPLAQALLQAQALNGAWQNPQETAFALLLLKTLAIRPGLEIGPEVLSRGQRYLLETQQYDGTWSADKLFVIPGVGGRFEHFAHPRLTTAFCLRALL